MLTRAWVGLAGDLEAVHVSASPDWYFVVHHDDHDNRRGDRTFYRDLDLCHHVLCHVESRVSVIVINSIDILLKYIHT